MLRCGCYVFNLPTGLFLSGLIAAITAWALLYTAFVRIPFEAALEGRGVEATGEITAFGEPYRPYRRGTKSVRHQRVYYTFEDATGARHHGDIALNRRRTRNWAVGRLFSVRYLPDAPHRHRISLQIINTGREGLAIGFGLLSAALTAMFVLLLRSPSDWSGPRIWPIISRTLS